jgi:hypothetical protein
MANLKLDLINKLNNDKFYAELELVRLAQEPNMHYRTKIDSMNLELEILAVTNAKLGLVEQYFQEPTPQATPTGQPAPQGAPAGQPVAEKPAGKVHPGQSHGE